ncbi:MAG: hypothetical protein CFE22_06480 [Cytophagaceae bacterium BCCC1]|nr:MAG: hypothetical protein CFE22_06480 [Cytophagaceae bacterium BCCC1]
MKKILILTVFTFSVYLFSCSGDSSTERTTIDSTSNTENEKVVTLSDTSDLLLNEFQAFLFKRDTLNPKKYPFWTTPVLPAYVIDFFNIRKDILSLQTIKDKQIDFKVVKKITLGKLLSYCQRDSTGDILFSYEIKNKKIDLKIYGKKKSNATASTIDLDIIDSGNSLENNERNIFYDLGIELKNANIRGFRTFSEKTQFISFSKKKTKEWINNLKTKYRFIDSTPIFIHFGFAGLNGDSHPGVLITSYNNLENEFSNLRSDADNSFAFGNKNGTCCPPQY